MILDRLKENGFSDQQANSLSKEFLNYKNKGFITKNDLMLAIANLENKLIIWMIGIAFAQTSLILTILNFLLKSKTG